MKITDTENVRKMLADAGETGDTLKRFFESSAQDTVELAANTVEGLVNGGKVLVFGNGGSAADAQHLEAEFTGRFLLERSPFPAIALTTNTSSLTAIANDYGYDRVFERQVNAFAAKGDVAIGISTSGNSESVIKALLAAKEKGALAVGLTGEGGGKMAGVCDILFAVPSRKTPRIQECHIAWIHAYCDLVERLFVERKAK